MTDLSDRKDDPELAPDAALAEDLGDEDKRKEEQLAYYGGDVDDIDDFDPTGLDDGSNLDFKPEEKADEEEADEKAAEAGKAEDKVDAKESDEQADEEPDAEEHQEAEAKSSDDDESDKKDEPKTQGIPKSRFDEVNERRKAAEKRLAELEAEKAAEQQAEKEEYDFDKAEMEYQDLLLDGKTDEALAKRREIRAAEHAVWKAETQSETVEHLSQQEQANEITNLSVEAEKMFPVFNEDHEDYDHNITNKVLTYYRGYVAGGEFDNLGDAFVAALADVVDLYDLTDRYGVNLDGSPVEDPKPEAKPAPEPKKDPNKAKLAEKAHKPVAGAGEGSADRGVAVPSIADMSDADLDRLSEEQIARLRGDFL